MSDANGPVEEMRAFFDARADGYEAHMASLGDDGLQAFYAAVAAAIPRTDAPLAVLDLGAGTGLELHGLFERAPRARVTCIDLSPGMLARLQARHSARAGQITVRQGSFLTASLGGPYDLALSVMAMHHYMPEVKAALYRRIHAALRPGGRYVEGDYIVSPDEEQDSLAHYAGARAAQGITNEAGVVHHLDIPLSGATQRRLLTEAGFASVAVPFTQEAAAVLVAQR